MFKSINVFYTDYRKVEGDQTGWVCYNCDLFKFRELVALEEEGAIKILRGTEGNF